MKLTVVSLNGQLVTDSREVAEMVEKEHSHLLRDIDGYINIIGKTNFGLSDFFIESSYQSGTRSYKCYLLTKKGCDMVANKMTGEKGVLFTAAYVTKFEDMEKQRLPQPMSQSELALLQAQNMVALEKRVDEQGVKINNITEILKLTNNDWRNKVNKIINAIAQKLGGNQYYQEIRKESYQLLESRANCILNRRLDNRKSKMALRGSSKTAINKISKLDVIEEDKKLVSVYLTVVKELAVKYQLDITSYQLTEQI